MKGKTLAERLREASDDRQELDASGISQDALDTLSPSSDALAPQSQAADGADGGVAAAPTVHGSENSAQAVKGAQGANKVCLIVDDSRVIRKVSTKIAKSLGYTPIEAQDGEEALARCMKSMPALVLTDWNMPEMDGIEFVRRLREIPTPNRPTVVFCTSNGEAADIHEGINAGADDYIVKPFNEAALKAKLEMLARG